MANDSNYQRHEEMSLSTKLSFFLIGSGIGAIVALLFAPKSGQELRGDIADATRKGIDRTRETAGAIGQKAGEYYEVGREKAGELYSTASTRATNIADNARDVAARKKDQLTAAIEAGKQAYEEERRKLDPGSSEPQ